MSFASSAKQRACWLYDAKWPASCVLNHASRGVPCTRGGRGIISIRARSMYTISRGAIVDDAETIEQARAILRGHPPGRYHIGEIAADPLPSGHTSRR
jgi:hypothetical protein